MPNSFRGSKSQDFTIIDSDDLIVGHIRVKPSSVLWRGRNKHRWHRLLFNDFAAYAENNGTLADH